MASLVLSPERGSGSSRRRSETCALFGLPPLEECIEDYSCAILGTRGLLKHGRMYITSGHLCFHSNLFGHKTTVTLSFSNITEITRGMQALINPSIRVLTVDDEHVFASFFIRENTFRVLYEAWKSTKATPSPLTNSPIHSPSVSDLQSQASELPSNSPLSEPHDVPLWHRDKPPEESRRAGQEDAVCSRSKNEDALANPVLSESFPCSAAELCKVLFDDESHFTKDLKLAHGGRADELEIDKWAQCDGEGRFREIRWSSYVKNKLCPVRRTRVHETQRCSCLQDSNTSVLQTHQIFLDVPYGDCFHIIYKWCVESSTLSEGSSPRCQSRLHISMDVIWSHSIWLKRSIESSAIAESREAYASIPALVHAALSRQQSVKQQSAISPPQTPSNRVASALRPLLQEASRATLQEPLHESAVVAGELSEYRLPSTAVKAKQGRRLTTLLALLLAFLAGAGTTYQLGTTHRLDALERCLHNHTSIIAAEQQAIRTQLTVLADSLVRLERAVHGAHAQPATHSLHMVPTCTANSSGHDACTSL